MRALALLRLPFCAPGFLILALPAILASQENRRTFRIEVYGGFSTLNAGDFNKRTEFDRLAEDYETELRYAYYHETFGNYFTYSGRIDGEFNKIKHALPLGLRLRYNLNPALSVSVGFKYFSSRQDSQVTYQYDVRSINPDGFLFYDEYSSTSSQDPYSISVGAFVPLVGIHYKIWGSRFFDFEAFAAAGPMFARCTYSSRRLSKSIDSYDYSTETTTTSEMEGTGTGIAFDAGLQVNLALKWGIDLLLEGGYALQSAGNISGPGRFESIIRDSNSSGYTLSEDWDGPWAMVEGAFNREWGNIPFSYPTNQYGSRGLSGFDLDLSGFQIRMGLSFRL